VIAPRIGTMVGALKYLCSTFSLRNTRTATLTMVKTTSSSNDVVPPSAAMSTKDTRMTAMPLVKTMEIHGVRRNGCTVPKNRGMIFSFDMP
jgi:hypothetical protein